MRKGFLFPAALVSVVATLPGAAQATSTTCATSTVCAEYIDTYSGSSGGVAIHGEANSGIGVRGTSVSNTGFYGASGSGLFTSPGVEGESTNNTLNDAGGAFGLAGLARGGTYPYLGVMGFGNYNGVYGEAKGGPPDNDFSKGVVGDDYTGKLNAGVLGYSSAGTGGVFLANQNSFFSLSSAPTAVLAIAEPTGNGNGAVAIDAQSSSFPLFAENTSTNPSYYVELSTPTDLIDAHNSGEKFYVTIAGNAYLSGTIMTSGGTYARKGASGTRRVAYGPQTTTPQIEDVGEGTLVNGRAVVAIDPDLADSIDMRRAYHVFLTPDGDCKGLYVAQRTPAGFVVRELQGGRSNLTFEYRLVAKPVDQDGERLARAAAQPEHPHPIVTAYGGIRSPRFLSPEARLEQRLGSQGYAKAIAELGRRIAGK